MSVAGDIVDDSSDGELEPPRNEDPPHDFAVVREDVELEVNFREKRIDGRADIFIAAFSDLDEVAIDARQCEIDLDNITVQPLRTGPDGAYVDVPPRKVPATYQDPYDLLDYPEHYKWTAEHHDVRQIRMRPLKRVRFDETPADMRDSKGCTPVDGALRIKLKPDGAKDEPAPDASRKPLVRIRSMTTMAAMAEEAEATAAAASAESRVKASYKISIPFAVSRPRDGLHFVGIDEGDRRYPHMYTRHSIEPGTACCIFPCVDDHGSRCQWKISVKIARTLGDALQQHPAAQGHENGLSNGVNGSAQRHNKRDFAMTEEDKLLEMTVVCSGNLTDEIVDPDDDHKKIMIFEPAKVSVQKLGFAVGPFEYVDLWSGFRSEEDDEKLTASAIKIHGYCLPGRADEVRNTCVALAAAADYFVLTFASYPFDSFKLCFLDDLVQDTVALYSLAFISTRILLPEDIIDNEIEVMRKIIHTIACQWSGIQLIPNTCRDTWIVVGIAYYMTDLFLKKLCGNNDYRFRMKTMADQLFELDKDRPSLWNLGHHLYLGDFEMDFMALKAPVVLFILDKRLTKASSSTGLERIVAKVLRKANIEDSESDSIISTEGFRTACVKNNKSNMKLDPFWAQWIYGAGCPDFYVHQRFNKKRLCVEMTLRQKQVIKPGQETDEDLEDRKKKANAPAFDKADFLRLVRESKHNVKGGKVQPLFTGPMTIRIHEADGTPYEHIVEIRDDNAKGSKFEIPYNTKYKRLKRNRRHKERLKDEQKADEENPDEVLVYCFGDLLQTPEEVAEWDLQDWPPDTERQMDLESYEWIRVDSDFEWALRLRTNMPAYMYVSQLQQDWDVVAQQDTMLYLNQFPIRPHPLISTFLIRTLLEQRYFHGIRTMAVEGLRIHAGEGLKNHEHGYTHLVKAFQEMFCYPDSSTPRPNDFTDKKQYAVQLVMPLALGRYRDAAGKCPLLVRRLLLDQLLYNDNSANPYSDHVYVAKLIEAVGASLIPEKAADPQEVVMAADTDNEQAAADKAFLEEALGEIDRYRRMDEWTNSYQNVWTIAALECKRRLMKAGVVPLRALDFVEYLQDATYDRVRIKAFEALADLGLMMDPCVFRLLLCCLGTDPSPFVRDRYVNALAMGLATLAFGEVPRPSMVAASAAGNAATAGGGEDDDDGDLMVVEAKETDRLTDLRRIEHDRKRHLPSALAALKTEVDEFYPSVLPRLQEAVWEAMDSPFLGRKEKITLLELCSLIFNEADSWIISLKYPKRWRVVPHAPGLRDGRRLLVKFQSYYRERPRGAPEQVVPVAKPDPPPEPPRRFIVSARPSISRQPSAKPSPISTPRPASTPIPPDAADSIVAAPVRPSIERKPSIALKPLPSASTAPAGESISAAARTPKRQREVSEGTSPTPIKKQKLQAEASPSGSERKRKPKNLVVTLKTPRLREVAISFAQGRAPKPGNARATASRTTTPQPAPRVKAESPSAPALGSVAAKPRKPLPSGPASAAATAAQAAPVPTPKAEEAAPSAPAAPAAPARPKIVLLKRPSMM